jgi:CDP-diacylglycerol--serine O-phosphatidyltransferase
VIFRLSIGDSFCEFDAMSLNPEEEEPKIYLLPNLMTAGNLLCGFLAVLTIFKGMQADDLVAAKPYYQNAMLYIFGSCIFDLLDGRLARLGGQESPFGQEFDSLADMISFGIAPALLVSRAVLADLEWETRLDPGGTGITWAVAFIYLLCGGIRLARFNCLARIGGGGGDFRGIPIPMAAGFVASLTYLIISSHEKTEGLTIGAWSYVLAVMILGVSFLMVSNINYPSFKKIDLKTKANIWTLLATGMLLFILIKFQTLAPPLIFIGYLMTPLFRGLKNKKNEAKSGDI